MWTVAGSESVSQKCKVLEEFSIQHFVQRSLTVFLFFGHAKIYWRRDGPWRTSPVLVRLPLEGSSRDVELIVELGYFRVLPDSAWPDESKKLQETTSRARLACIVQ